jgi:hypothetical protein
MPVFGVIYAKCNGVKERMVLGLKKRSNLQPGSQQVQTAHKEPTAINADTMWRLGMMGALGIFVPNRNIDKGNRR